MASACGLNTSYAEKPLRLTRFRAVMEIAPEIGPLARDHGDEAAEPSRCAGGGAPQMHPPARGHEDSSWQRQMYPMEMAPIPLEMAPIPHPMEMAAIPHRAAGMPRNNTLVRLYGDMERF